MGGQHSNTLHLLTDHRDQVKSVEMCGWHTHQPVLSRVFMWHFLASNLSARGLNTCNIFIIFWGQSDWSKAPYENYQGVFSSCMIWCTNCASLKTGWHFPFLFLEQWLVHCIIILCDLRVLNIVLCSLTAKTILRHVFLDDFTMTDLRECTNSELHFMRK